MFFHLLFTFNIISSIENYFLIVLVDNNNTFGFNSVSCKVWCRDGKWLKLIA